MNQKTKKIATVAVIAALYTAVSLLLAPISFGNIQFRIAECLTLLPLIWKDGIYAVTLGCFLTNLIGFMLGQTFVVDIVFGTAATLIAAVLTYNLRNVKLFNIPVLAILMPVVANGLIIGAMLAVMLAPAESFLPTFAVFAFEVAAGEMFAVIIGYFVIKGLAKSKLFED